MKKLSLVLFVASMVFGFANRADAVVVDSAAARVCLKGKASGDDWNPNTSPHCVCGSGAGEKERVNLMVPGPKFKNLVGKYGDYSDRCATVEEIKKSPKPEVKKAEAPAPAPSVKFGAMLTPGDANEVKGGATVKQSLIVTSGSKLVDRFVVSCSACNVNNENPLIVSKPLIPDTGYVFNLTPANPEVATTANFIVKVIAKNGAELGTFTASVGWSGKTPPPPVDSPAKIACEAPGSDGTFVKATGRCLCLGDTEEKNGVCVKKTAASATETKTIVGRDGSSRLHLRIDGFGGYARSDQFKTPFFGLALGLSFDFLRYLSGYVEGGFQFPGATRTDSQNKPVLLADGSTDKRTNSIMLEAGLEYVAAEYVMLTGGVLIQALGVTAGQSNPVHLAVAGKFGVKIIAYSVPTLRLAIGPSLIMGVESRGNTPANMWFGGLLNVTAEVWNIIPYGK